jgi:hypothetical protein
MGKIEKYKDFARKFQHKWNQDTPTEINLPNYLDEEEEKKKVEMEKELENTEDEISESYLNSKELIFTGKRNVNLQIKVTLDNSMRIESIDNKANIRFPFQVDQIINRNIEVWACNNNFLLNGKDTCPEKKIFGVRASDVPQGHEWRKIYPGKFK